MSKNIDENGLVTKEVTEKPGRSPKQVTENLVERNTHTNNENHRKITGGNSCKENHSSCSTDKNFRMFENKSSNVNKQEIEGKCSQTKI